MKKLAVLSGAGVSKESGINTFRDSDGMWEQYRVEEVASIEGWYRNRIIAALEKDFDVTVITQNIDNLHERAGSSRVLHLHGEITKARGERSPKPVYDIGYSDIRLGDLDDRGEQLRPDIVWFGEAVPMIEPAAEIVSECDILLVIGTSLVVYPAAGLVNYVRNGVPLYLVDPKPIHVGYKYYTQIQDVATAGMRRFLDLVPSLK